MESIPPQTLPVPSDVQGYYQFGFSVAVNNDAANRTILVGTRGGSGNFGAPGAAYAFVLVGNTWMFQHEFNPTGGGATDAFGWSVALSSDGNTALIGAPETNDIATSTYRQGVVYSYTRSGANWTQQQRFTDTTPPGPSAPLGDHFGVSVWLSDDGGIALIGADVKGYPGLYHGDALVYTGTSGVYGSEQTLAANDPNPPTPPFNTSDSFGWSVSLSGDGKTALVGAFNHIDPSLVRNPTAAATGSAYVFTNTGGFWGAPIELNESINTQADGYGYRVAISGDGLTAVVGAPFFGDPAVVPTSNYGQGAVWLYTLGGATALPVGQQPVVASDAMLGDEFGVAVAVPQTGTSFISGASTKTIGANANQGQVYDLFLSPDLSPAPGALPAGTVGTPYNNGTGVQFTATNGAGSPYTYATAPTGGTLSAGQTDGPPPGVTINTSTGLFSGTPTTAGSYIFYVSATDKAGGVTTQQYTVTIAAGATTTAVTVTPPSVSYSTASQSIALSATVTSSPAGVTVNEGTVTFTVQDSGNATVGATIPAVPVSGGAATANYTLPAGQGAGVYTVTATYTPAATAPSFTGSASTGGTLTVTSDATTTAVAATPPSVPFSAATQSISLSATVASSPPGVAVNEGTVTFTVTQGATTIGSAVGPVPVSGGAATANYTLPAGQAGGVYTITAAYTPGADFVGSSGTGTLTVSAGTLAIAPATLPDGTVGVPYSQQLAASGGSGAGYAFSAPAASLPPGLTLTAAGLLAGTPTVAGPYTFTVTATDSASNTGSRSYTVTIAAAGPAPVTVAPATLPNGTVTVPYGQQLTASGGSGGYTFAATAGTLPAGLTLSSAGLLAGTPTAAGPYTFTMTATDSASNTGTRQYTVTIAAAPAVPVTPTGLTVAGSPSVGGPGAMKVGQTAPFTATASFSDGSTAVVTGQAQWGTSNAAVASVDAGGVVTAKSGGPATITATYTFNGTTKTAGAAVTVAAPILTGVQPQPAPAGRPGAASVPAGPSPAPAPAPPSR